MQEHAEERDRTAGRGRKKRRLKRGEEGELKAAEHGMGRELERRMTGEWRTLGGRGRRRSSSDGDEQRDVHYESCPGRLHANGETAH